MTDQLEISFEMMLFFRQEFLKNLPDNSDRSQNVTEGISRLTEAVLLSTFNPGRIWLDTSCEVILETLSNQLSNTLPFCLDVSYEVIIGQQKLGEAAPFSGDELKSL